MYLLVFYYLIVFNTNKMMSINRFYFFNSFLKTHALQNKNSDQKIHFKIGEAHETFNSISIIFKTGFWQRS